MEYNELEGLSSFHLDVIRETVNIGAGNAATALSQLLGSVVTMDVPKAELVSIYDISDRYASPTELVCAVYLRFEGEISGNMLWIMNEEVSGQLVKVLAKKNLGNISVEQLNEVTDSLLVEVGNIVLSSFLNAISSMINSSLPVTVPAIAHDMLGAILDLLAAYYGMVGDVAIVSEANLRIMDYETPMNGHVMLLPDPQSLSMLLSKLGVL
ncbi:chemotaxis protein CheC [Acetomicrobium hydrogeniformans]|jgi:chemotaxis protein CheC|uniref:CheC-like family protein n=1 Tax=Acetomicrobium hydrogeniformans ATCC BAA-1850 TaxID=592015 RepID=A0A0T5XB97_9BACT|nr:chemotaxis protein CheC [Acetomicrobium hydrogeniformans]KRT35632.1 CheC-like family protein [Acetomicrobium hydrogeniformans ATCC BAA-1850]